MFHGPTRLLRKSAPQPPAPTTIAPAPYSSLPPDKQMRHSDWLALPIVDNYELRHGPRAQASTRALITWLLIIANDGWYRLKTEGPGTFHYLNATMRRPSGAQHTRAVTVHKMPPRARTTSQPRGKSNNSKCLAAEVSRINFSLASVCSNRFSAALCPPGQRAFLIYALTGYNHTHEITRN
jgi:hypothetical protein